MRRKNSGKKWTEPVYKRGGDDVEQPIAVKCFLCGSTARYAYAYARLNDRENFHGVIFRGVCEECLADYIDKVKADKHARTDGWIWLAAILPVGGLLAALAESVVWQWVGFGLILLAVLWPLGSRLTQRWEARRANNASEEENERRYSEQMCLEDAQRTNRQFRLIPLHERYRSAEYTIERISDEAGVSRVTAALLKPATETAFRRMEQARSAVGFDNAHVV